MWSQQLNYLPYCEWNIGAATTLDYWIGVELLGKFEDTYIFLLQGNSGKGKEIPTCQYIVLKKCKFELIGIDDEVHSRDIVYANTCMLPDTTM